MTAVDPAQAGVVGPALLAWLRGRLCSPDLSFAEEPAPVGDGWETYIYGFRLADAPAGDAWLQPLILRIFPTSALAPRAELEVATQRFVTERGFPAPRPLMIEAGDTALGLPFMIMERVPGRTVLDKLSENPLAGRRLIPAMAELNARLHRLPAEGCPLPAEGPLVDRQLVGFRARIDEFGLAELEPELGWLHANKSGVEEEERSVCHGDFHPNNVLVSDAGELCVIDWGRAALGDRHHDLAATLLVMRAAPIQPRNMVERLLDRFGRSMFIRRYLGAYRKHLPIDNARLRYWEALEAFEWMVRVSAMQKVGSAGYGIRSGTAARFPPGHLERLRTLFWRYAKD